MSDEGSYCRVVVFCVGLAYGNEYIYTYDLPILFGGEQVEKKSHAASKPVGRCASFKRSGAWAVLKKNGGKWPQHKKAAKEEKKVRRQHVCWACHWCIQSQKCRRFGAGIYVEVEVKVF